MDTRIEDERPIWDGDDDRVIEVVEPDPVEVAIGETLAKRILSVHATSEADIEAARHIARTVKAYRHEMAAE